jgi:hypothetical protein
MKTGALFLLMIFNMAGGYAQNAKDYLCLDPNVILYYQFHTGDTCTMQFDTTFVYEGDTICYYTRTFLGEEGSSTLFYAYNGAYLTKGNYQVTSEFKGVNENDTKIKIVGPGEVADTAYTIAFDMSSTDFIQTSSFKANYTDSHGNVHQNVVLIDQANPNEGYNYITVFAPGIGVVSRDGREMEFIRMEKLPIKK